MIGVLINAGAVILGSLVGMLLRRGIPKRVADAVMLGIGACVVAIGIQGIFEGGNILISLASMASGAIVGTLLDIDGRLNRLGDRVGKAFSSGGQASSLAEGFVTASLVFCVGAMTIVGCLNAGLKGDNEMLITKACIDCIAAMMLSVSLGIGVMFSSVFVFVSQGSLVLLAKLVAPLLSEAAIGEMTAVGSLVILLLGLNLLGLSRFKVADYMPAILLAPLFTALAALLPIV